MKEKKRSIFDGVPAFQRRDACNWEVWMSGATLSGHAVNHFVTDDLVFWATRATGTTSEQQLCHVEKHFHPDKSV